MHQGSNSVGEQLGVAIDFNFLDPNVVQALTNRRVIIKHTTERVRADLREALSEGLDSGETEDQLRRRVLDFFGGERANARTIARTETFSAFSEGRFDGMKQAGLTRHAWLTSRDGNVRDAHIGVDREVRPVGDTFSNGLLYPLDPNGLPGQVINCRCVTIPSGPV